MEKLLEIKNFGLTFKNSDGMFYLLRDINLDILRNQKIGIIGESGSGKTSLANAIIQLFDNDTVQYSGEINFFSKKDCCKNDSSIVILNEAKNIGFSQMKHFRGNHISMIFQDPFNALNPVVRVGKQVEEIILNHRHEILKQDLYSEVLKLLSKVQLDEPGIVYKKFPHQLSGGQLQRVCIAIAIANKPELLIADEPTTALDASLRQDILDLLSDIAQKNESSLMLITHDINIVREHIEFLYILYAGELIEFGEMKKIIKNPRHPYTQMLISAYPEKSKKGSRLPVVPGQIPNLRVKQNFEKCIFYERCPKKIEICDSAKPEVYDGVKCFLYEKK